MSDHGMKRVVIPSYDDAEAACMSGDATPIDEFVFTHEPADDDRVFRQQLQAVVDYVRDLPPQ